MLGFFPPLFKNNSWFLLQSPLKQYCWRLYKTVHISNAYVFSQILILQTYRPMYWVCNHSPVVWGLCWGFPGGSDGKKSAYNGADPGSIPWLGRSPGGGHGNPLWYSCLENPMHRGAWQATVLWITKTQTRLSNWHSSLCEAPECHVGLLAGKEWITSEASGYFLSDWSHCWNQSFLLQGFSSETPGWDQPSSG